MSAGANIRQNEGAGDVTVAIAHLLVHHAGALSRIGGAQVAVVNLHRHLGVRGETAQSKGNHAVLAHRGGDGRGGTGGGSLRAARGQGGGATHSQAQGQGGRGAGGQGFAGEGCLRGGSRKRCTHGGPFTFFRGGRRSRCRAPRWFWSGSAAFILEKRRRRSGEPYRERSRALGGGLLVRASAGQRQGQNHQAGRGEQQIIRVVDEPLGRAGQLGALNGRALSGQGRGAG